MTPWRLNLWRFGRTKFITPINTKQLSNLDDFSFEIVTNKIYCEVLIINFWHYYSRYEFLLSPFFLSFVSMMNNQSKKKNHSSLRISCFWTFSLSSFSSQRLIKTQKQKIFKSSLENLIIILMIMIDPITISEKNYIYIFVFVFLYFFYELIGIISKIFSWIMQPQVYVYENIV